MYYLIIGGAGSGKSEYAEDLALSLKDDGDSLYYIATMYPYGDEETKKRIERHRIMRAGKGFVTIERSSEISGVLDEIKVHMEETDCTSGGEQDDCYAVKSDYRSDQLAENIPDPEYHKLKNSVVLLEDLTNLYANECYQTTGHPHEIVKPLREFAANVKALIVVSNELYSGGIRYPEETMEFLRELASINRDIAKDADKVLEVVAGIPVVIK